MKHQYPNLLSRILLEAGFNHQFAFPVMDTSWAERFFALVERVLPKPDHLPEIKAPIFVIGLPRTGSTWLQTLLCTHPALAYFTQLMHHYRSCIRGANTVAHWLRLDGSGERFIRDSIVNGLHTPSEGVAIWGEWLGHDPNCLCAQSRTLAEIPQDILRQIMETIATVLYEFPGSSRFFCKNPGFIAYAPLLAELFPDAKFIHLIRAPRPTANSMVKLLARCDEQLEIIKQSGKPTVVPVTRFVPYPRLPRLAEYVERFGADDVRTTARLWRDAIRFMEENGEQLPNVLTVRFESIVALPKQTIARILNFCDLQPFSDEQGVFADLCSKTVKVGHINKYGHYELIDAVCAREAILMGYGEQGELRPPQAPSRCFGAVL